MLFERCHTKNRKRSLNQHKKFFYFRCTIRLNHNRQKMGGQSGSWTPTKRRGPIAAEFQGPGPASLVLPSLFGSEWEYRAEYLKVRQTCTTLYRHEMKGVPPPVCQLNIRNPVLEGLCVPHLVLHSPPMLAYKRNLMCGFHRPSKTIFLRFSLCVSHCAHRITSIPNFKHDTRYYGIK